MPLPFILAGLAALGSAAAGTAAAVGTAAATVGAAAAGAAGAAAAAGTAAAAAVGATAVAAGTAAVAAAGTAVATVGAAAAAIGATTVIAGITAGQILTGAGLVFAGLVVTDQIKKQIENAQTEGFKDGYANASREYEEKFQNQAKAFMRQMEKTQENISQSKDREARQERLAKELYRLLGEAMGIIEGFQEKGETAHEDTIHLCALLQRLAEDLNQKAA